MILFEKFEFKLNGWEILPLLWYGNTSAQVHRLVLRNDLQKV